MSLLCGVGQWPLGWVGGSSHGICGLPVCGSILLSHSAWALLPFYLRVSLMRGIGGARVGLRPGFLGWGGGWRGAAPPLGGRDRCQRGLLSLPWLQAFCLVSWESLASSVFPVGPMPCVVSPLGSETRVWGPSGWPCGGMRSFRFSGMWGTAGWAAG